MSPSVSEKLREIIDEEVAETFWGVYVSTLVQEMIRGDRLLSKQDIEYLVKLSNELPSLTTYGNLAKCTFDVMARIREDSRGASQSAVLLVSHEDYLETIKSTHGLFDSNNLPAYGTVYLYGIRVLPTKHLKAGSAIVACKSKFPEMPYTKTIYKMEIKGEHQQD